MGLAQRACFYKLKSAQFIIEKITTSKKPTHSPCSSCYLSSPARYPLHKKTSYVF